MTNKFVSALVLAVICFASCNSQNDAGKQEQANTEKQQENSLIAAGDIDPYARIDTAIQYVDSFKIEMDSLMKAKIDLPPVYMHEVLEANDDAVSKFTKLSNACRGNIKVLVNAKLIAGEVAKTAVAATADKSDLLLLIDRTYSMGDDIATVKAGVSQIIDTIKKHKGVRLAVAIYGDKNCDGDKWFEFKNFETDYDAAMEYINSIEVFGGCDLPESVYEAFFNSIDNKFWKSTKKCSIILIGDAPPLEKPLSDHTMADVIAKAKERKVIMNFYPIIITPQIEDARLPAAEIEKYKQLKLITNVYPNPTQGHIDVSLDETRSYYMEVYNVQGQVMLSEPFFGILWSKDLNDFPNGMYVLRVICEDHRFDLVKFVVQH